MKRPWHAGLLFGVCVAVVMLAMGWISLKVLALDRAEVRARRQARLEENVRLALWRMDSVLAPLIAQESARPYFCYTAFYPAERAYTQMYAEIQPQEVRLASPLLTNIAPHVLVHFQIARDDRMTSPQVPVGKMRETAINGYTTLERIQNAEWHISRLRPKLDHATLWTALPLSPTTQPLASAPPIITASLAGVSDERTLSSVERTKRVMTYEQAAGTKWMTPGSCRICLEVDEGMMKPMWARNALIVARKVSINHDEYIQGCQLDWDAIRPSLIADVTDLLPQADLQPVLASSTNRPTRMLAALPVQLIPGEIPFEATSKLSPLRIALLGAWVCVLLAIIAAAMLLRGALLLSERRGAFVSAVTHELRTPLTTLRMYAEMLADRMVKDEPTRDQYLGTMRAEADRLAHLVDNVLSYSRLENSKPDQRIVDVSLADLLHQVRPRLAQRAEQANMTLSTSSEVPAVSVRADPAAVEQILFNLVDNACKYAANASNRTIEIDCKANGQFAELQVQDHGPGVHADEARRLFQAFTKSADQAANSAPGIGLGLALSRRLAREMGGDLNLVYKKPPGASFVLTLKFAKSI